MIDYNQNIEILRNLDDNKDFAGLIDYCNSLIELDNTNYIFFGARGKAYIELEEYDIAIIDLSIALELFPNYILGLYNRGICYYETDKYEMAIKDLEKAKSLNNELYRIDFYLGGSYSCLEKYQKAIELFSEHLLIYEDEAALKWRADLYYLTDQFNNANIDFAELLLFETTNLENIEKINSLKNEVIINTEYHNNQLVLSEIGFFTLKDEICSGIYIIEFKNNEFYVGQAKKIQKRIKQHYKKYNDIKTVYFKPVTENLLFFEENKTIAIFETNKFRIRNLKQIEFLNIFDNNCQFEWINNINFNCLSGNKFNNEDVRVKFKEKFQNLKEKPYFEELILLLSNYFKKSIPNYVASEFNYWNITCMPNYLKEENCITRININEVPVLSVFEGVDESLTFLVFVSKLPYLRYLKENPVNSLLDQISDFRLDVGDDFEEKTEGDGISLWINQKDFFNALDNQLVLSSIRLFNLRMMNNVGKKSKFRRTPYHCLDLSDFIINRLLQDV
jgi:tetratricopeptide (TPR) repeat protein